MDISFESTPACDKQADGRKDTPPITRSRSSTAVCDEKIEIEIFFICETHAADVSIIVWVVTRVSETKTTICNSNHSTSDMKDHANSSWHPLNSFQQCRRCRFCIWMQHQFNSVLARFYVKYTSSSLYITPLAAHNKIRTIHIHKIHKNRDEKYYKVSVPAKTRHTATASLTHTYYCLSNAMHGQNINLPACVCVCMCVRHTFVNSPTGQTLRPLNIFLQLIP